jgi:hypothetical protein
MLLFIDLPLQSIVRLLQLHTLPQNVIDGPLDLSHLFVNKAHIFLFALCLLDHLFDLADLQLMRFLHFVDDANEDVVALSSLCLFLLDFVFVEEMQIFKAFMQLNGLFSFRERRLEVGPADLRIADRLRLVVRRIFSSNIRRLVPQLFA